MLSSFIQRHGLQRLTECHGRFFTPGPGRTGPSPSWSVGVLALLVALTWCSPAAALAPDGAVATPPIWLWWTALGVVLLIGIVCIVALLFVLRSVNQWAGRITSLEHGLASTREDYARRTDLDRLHEHIRKDVHASQELILSEIRSIGAKVDLVKADHAQLLKLLE